ncbi:MAG TPA: metal ABC transporter permease [Pedococcus sp.]|nr:metal ABC transporter permease [Pedococcus sp.]
MNTHGLLAEITFQSNWVQVLQAPFMRNAIIGGSIVALVSGIIGYFVIVRSSSFATHALAHIGFPGATGAVLVGAPVTLGLAVFCVAGALAIGALGRRASERDVATGTILAFATGLGIMFASLATRNTSTVTNVLFGNLLAITSDQLWVFAAFAVVIALAIAYAFRPLLFASIDVEVAQARGVPVRGLGIVFMVLLALVITMAVQVVGTLLLFALVVTPAATAIAWTARPGYAIAASAGIALVSVWLGLVLAVMFDLPPSFFIVTIATMIWLATWLLSRRSGQDAIHRDAHGDHHHTGHEPSLTA